MRRKVFVLLLSLAVMLSMSLSGAVFAAEEAASFDASEGTPAEDAYYADLGFNAAALDREVDLSAEKDAKSLEASEVPLVDLNKANPENVVPVLAKSAVPAVLPVDGMLLLICGTDYYINLYYDAAHTSKVGYDYYTYETITDNSGNNLRFYYFTLPKGTYYIYSDYDSFNVAGGYAASGSKQMANNTEYVHGSTAGGGSQFTINVPATGYITLTLADYSTMKYSVKFKAKGFKDFQMLTSKANTTNIPVAKGTYTFTVSTYAPAYVVKYKFNKVAESKFGASKKKAVKIKKKATVKGVIPTGTNKVHWYKFKNTKKKKVKIILSGMKMNSGENYSSGLKVTLYGKGFKGTKGQAKISYSYSGYEIQPYNALGMKLKKGTYYIKVERYGNASATYNMKWQ